MQRSQPVSGGSGRAHISRLSTGRCASRGQTALCDNHAGTLGINGHIGYGDHTVALEHSREVSNEKECRDDDVRDGLSAGGMCGRCPSGTETADADSGPIRAPIPTGDDPLEPSDAAYPDGGIMPPADVGRV